MQPIDAKYAPLRRWRAQTGRIGRMIQLRTTAVGVAETIGLGNLRTPNSEESHYAHSWLLAQKAYLGASSGRRLGPYLTTDKSKRTRMTVS